MTTWLHFIGRQYYNTEAAFIKEAKRHGVSRRIGLRNLGVFRFGDRVLLAMWDGRSAVVFGEFTVSIVSGLDYAVTEELNKRGLIKEQISSGGTFVRRGCGSYYIGAGYSIKCDIDKIVEVVQELEKELGAVATPMICGSFKKRERVRINIAFSRGFRRFNLEEFEEAIRTAKLKAEAIGKRPRIIRVSGVFLGEREERRAMSVEGQVQEVKEYAKKGE